MRCIIELPNGEWLDGLTPGHLAGCTTVNSARVFESAREAKSWAVHNGIYEYDLWSEDGETWLGDYRIVGPVNIRERKSGTRAVKDLDASAQSR